MRACGACGKELARKDRERPSKFRKRKTCGIGACSSLARWSAWTDAVLDRSACRTCAACGDSLTRNEREPPHRFAKRTTCGSRCRGALVRHRALNHDIGGVMMTVSEIATMTGLHEGVVSRRVRLAKPLIAPADRRSRRATPHEFACNAIDPILRDVIGEQS